MKKYTLNQIQDFKDYLYYNLQQGTFRGKMVRRIIKNKSWDKVDEMMQESDAFSDALNQGGS
jgi:uncharacterized protein (UPF0335 family)